MSDALSLKEKGNFFNALNNSINKYMHSNLKVMLICVLNSNSKTKLNKKKLNILLLT